MKQDDDLRKSIVQQILQKSTDTRRIIVPVEGQGGTLMCAQTFLATLQTGGQLGGHDLRGSAGAKQFTHQLRRFIDVGYSRRRSSEKVWAN